MESMVSKSAWRLGWTAILVLAGAIGCSAPASEAPPQPEPEPEVVRAAALIDAWNGEGTNLETAKQELDKLLQRNPSSAPAHREYARYYIVSRHIRGPFFEPGTMNVALASVDQAIALQPQYAAAHVLRGRILTNLGRLEDAEAALDRAEAMHTDDPWLALNRADLRLAQGRSEDAFDICSDVSERTPAVRIRVAANRCLIDYFYATNQQFRSDEAYHRILADEPGSAWSRSEYASHLVCWNDDPLTAVREARTAIGIMDHGMAREALSGALARLWAQQIEEGDIASAQRTLQEANRIDDAPPIALITRSCGAGPIALSVARAAYRTGQIAAGSPSDAIALAGPVDSVGELAVVEMRVASARRDERDAFLNSKADDRDQGSLTVHFSQAGVYGFTAMYGQSPDVVLRGKRIVVAGYVRKERIEVRADGAPEGRVEEQTHLWVDDPSQLFAIAGMAAPAKS